ncbi:MAG: magnesium transporter [Oscillospiraceae bacterium]|nr:magnesium transporter [Oscillospiraceae bacterium]
MTESIAKEISILIKDKAFENLKSLLAGLEEMELLQAFYDLDNKEQVVAFRLLAKNVALAIFEQLDTDAQENLLHSFTDETTKEYVNEMAPDDRVKLLEELPASVAQKLIASLSPEERDSTNLLMGYAPQTAGRIMTTEFISLRRDMTVEQALEKISIQAEDKETVYTLFVTDSEKKLEGVLTLKGLLIARGLGGANKTGSTNTIATIGKTDGNTLVGNIMSKNAISVSTCTDQEEVAKTLQELDLLAVPVVDNEGRLVGIVTIDDAIDILRDEVTEDIFDQAGLAAINDNESDRSEVLINGSLWRIWKVRLPILVATLALGMVSGLVIGEFEDTLEAIAGVAIFIPVIMGMGGNIGTQSSTVFSRGVVLGHIQINKFWQPFLKEIGVGLSIGTLVGIISGVVASFWLGMPMLGLAVGLAMMITMTIATLLGFFVPYVLIKLKLDQAAGSAPIITTIKDIVALVIYFVCVSAFMEAI